MNIDRATLISIHELCAGFGAVRVLDGINFDLRPGEHLSLVGPNGSGKTTLLKCLGGLLVPQSGRVILRGLELRRCRRAELARHIAYVPQYLERILPHRVLDFVLMGRYPHLSFTKSVRPRDRRVCQEALELCGVAELQDRILAELSGGERQLVVIAAALAQEPELLLLDEPATYLDPAFQHRVLSALRKIRREAGVALVAATHDVNAALTESDTILALKAGRSFRFGSADEFRDPELFSQLYDHRFVAFTRSGSACPLLYPDLGTGEVR